MYSFKNDYSDGAHPAILKALAESNDVQTEGYGEDRFSLEAANLLKRKIGRKDVDVHFITGGTLTNQVAISAFLKPHEAVISAKSGHIYVHETGAIETTGHKVIPAESSDGKLYPKQIVNVVTEHHFEHMVKPRLVYISQPTETGTLYSGTELEELWKLCGKLNLLLYIDGARLASAIASRKSDTTLPDYANLCDSFYIGGTKNGALFGEALVICNDHLKKDFRYHLKQKGALSAKGRVLGIQFLTLFTDDLYLKLAAHSNKMAEKLQSGIESAGFKMLFHSYTNQIFPIMPEKVIAGLEKKYLFYRWEKTEDGSPTIRLVCSWSTEEKYIDDFIKSCSEFS